MAAKTALVAGLTVCLAKERELQRAWKSTLGISDCLFATGC